MNYLFTIFHRLNSGGVRLNNQEIRNCIYSGAFNDMLKVFDRENVDWKVLIRRIRGSMNRFRSVELALRVLAFSDRRGNYEGNLARFLNDYMQDQRVQPDAVIVAFRKRLSLIAKWARQIVSDQPRTKRSLLVVEALLVALDVHRDQLCLVSDEVLAQRYAAMQKEPIFMNPASNAVMRADNVRNRLDAAIKAFSV